MRMFECIPDVIYGIPTLPFLGLILGIAFAVNEAVRTKFKKAVIKAGDNSIVFDNRYALTAVLGIVVVLLTVESIKEAGLLNPVPNNFTGFFTAVIGGFTEGWAVIRTLNNRLDVYIKQKAQDGGMSEEKAQELADAVEFVEVEEEKPSTTSFEEL